VDRHLSRWSVATCFFFGEAPHWNGVCFTPNGEKHRASESYPSFSDQGTTGAGKKVVAPLAWGAGGEHRSRKERWKTRKGKRGKTWGKMRRSGASSAT
jgi:hypothetical protein